MALGARRQARFGGLEEGTMRERLETVATAVLVTCALTITGLTFRVGFASRPMDTSPSGKVRYFNDWRSFESVGRRIGSPNARATIVEFLDYECPYCRRFGGGLSDVLTDVDARHPNQ